MSSLQKLFGHKRLVLDGFLKCCGRLLTPPQPEKGQGSAIHRLYQAIIGVAFSNLENVIVSI